jgi:ABC-type multidrug transport system fused ATPase/permease subunit
VPHACSPAALDRNPLTKLKGYWRGTSIARSIQILSKADQWKVLAVAVVQICMSVLDLLGVILIGLLGALSVTGLQLQEPGNRVGSALRILHISEFTFQQQAIILSVLAVSLMVGKTFLSIFFTRRILFFLSRRGAMISANLISRLLAQPLLTVQSKTTQESLFAVTRGVEMIVLQVLATSVVMISDLSLLLIMAIGLFIVDPMTAVSSFSVFSLIGYFLYRFMHVRAGALGVRSSALNVESNEKIVEVFGSYRELVVRNRRDYYAREIGKLRYGLADASAEIGFLPYVSKYVIETSVILGALLIGVIQFILQDATQAVSTLAIFLAAGTRIAPAVLRVQQGSITVQGGLGQGSFTLNLIDELGNFPMVENIDDTLDIIHDGFKPEIKVMDASLTYPNRLSPAISNISFTIAPGKSVAFVGPSGAGKTTIVDILLGVLKPDHGSVLISGMPPLQAVAKWPGSISYVPQDVLISAGTFRENVALGYPIELATDELVINALKIAHLDEFVLNLPNGLDAQVGERGAKISGGQRQRLGIARAMFTCPHLLVLDEATSALDGETELSISNAIHELRGSTTVLLIAHRLSTVQNADYVVYLSQGSVLASGSFDEVREAIPDFDRQARLMGL